jgi:hypothetical protein
VPSFAEVEIYNEDHELRGHLKSMESGVSRSEELKDNHGEEGRWLKACSHLTVPPHTNRRWKHGV